MRPFYAKDADGGRVIVLAFPTPQLAVVAYANRVLLSYPIASLRIENAAGDWPFDVRWEDDDE